MYDFMVVPTGTNCTPVFIRIHPVVCKLNHADRHDQSACGHAMHIMHRSDKEFSALSLCCGGLKPCHCAYIGPLSIPQMMHERIWRSGAIIMTGQNRRSGRETCPSATLSITSRWVRTRASAVRSRLPTT
jgi:hypothetical protein